MRPRRSAAATFAFAAISVLRLKNVSCLLLKSASLKAAATFLALRLPVALRLVPRARVRLAGPVHELAVLLLVRAVARLGLLRGLLGAGHACLRHCRRRALARCCGRA